MDLNQPTTPQTSSPVYAPASEAPGMFGTKIPSTVAFVIGVLLFFMPFSEIKCSNSAVMNNSGLRFALGKDWQLAGGYGKDMMGDMGSKANSSKAVNAQYFIIAALGLGALGLFLSLTEAKTGMRVAMVSGIVAAGALIAFMLDIKKWFNDGMAKQAADKVSEGADSLGMGDAKFTLAFTTWFYIAVIAFLAAAFFCYKRMSASKT